jgi:hypothetical protein
MSSARTSLAADDAHYRRREHFPDRKSHSFTAAQSFGLKSPILCTFSQFNAQALNSLEYALSIKTVVFDK